MLRIGFRSTPRSPAGRWRSGAAAGGLIVVLVVLFVLTLGHDAASLAAEAPPEGGGHGYPDGSGGDDAPDPAPPEGVGDVVDAIIDVVDGTDDDGGDGAEDDGGDGAEDDGGDGNGGSGTPAPPPTAEPSTPPATEEPAATPTTEEPAAPPATAEPAAPPATEEPAAPPATAEPSAPPAIPRPSPATGGSDGAGGPRPSAAPPSHEVFGGRTAGGEIPAIPAPAGTGTDAGAAAREPSRGEADGDAPTDAGAPSTGHLLGGPDRASESQPVDGATADGERRAVTSTEAGSSDQEATTPGSDGTAPGPGGRDGWPITRSVADAFAPPAEGGSVAWWLLTGSVLTALLIVSVVALQRARGAATSDATRVRTAGSARSAGDGSRGDRRAPARPVGPGPTPAAGTTSLRRAGTPSGTGTGLLVSSAATPALEGDVATGPAPAVPVDPPEGRLADAVDRIAAEAGVPAETLHAAAADVRARRDAAVAGARAASRDAATEAHIAAFCLPVTPLGTGALLLAFGGGPGISMPQGGLAWSALVVACALTVVGMRWTRQLPSERSRVLASVEAAHDRRQRGIEQLRDALQTAQLHAAAGLDGAAALDLATAGAPEHPLHRLLARADAEPTGPDADRVPSLSALLRAAVAAPAGDGERAWARVDERLLHGHQRRLHRDRVNLVRVRALGPFLVGAVGSAALVVTAFSIAA